MQKPLNIKWALVLKSLLLLSLSLILITGGLLNIINEYRRPFMHFPLLELGGMVVGLALAMLAALSFITIENRQLIKCLRLAFNALLLLFGGWLLFIGGACIISCSGYFEQARYLAVGVMVVGSGTMAHALPVIPATLRTILGLLMGMVLLCGGGGYFLFMLLLTNRFPISNDELPGFLLHMSLPLGVAWLGVRFLLTGYRFFSVRKSPV